MQNNKALAGLKILDFTRVYSGPYCTMLLADMGAEVIKIEAIGKGDDTRSFLPIKDGESGYYLYLNRNKKSITLNLKAPEGKKIAMDLAREADVVIENFSAGTMKRLGLSYEDIKTVNAEVIYASLSGFGQQGPYSKRPAYDAIAQAMGGLTSLTGFYNGLPVKAGPAISDAVTGVHMALAIMIAAYYRQKTGIGQYIDVAMMDTVFSLLENAVPTYSFTGNYPERLGNGSPSNSPYNLYRTLDGLIVIGASNDNTFYKLARAIGREDLISNPRFISNPARKANNDELDAIIEDWTKQHSTREIEDHLSSAAVPVAPVKTIKDLMEDPQIKVREMVIEQNHPVLGKVQFPGNPLKLQITPPVTNKCAPALGENTFEILSAMGYSDTEITKLKEEKVI